MKKLTVCLVFLTLLGVVAGLVYTHYESIRIPTSMAPLKRKARPKDTVVCEIVANISSGYILKMGIAVPCENSRQKKTLADNMTRIKSSFLTSMNPNQMKSWVIERNYAAIKSEFLKSVNRFSAQPVKEVYFETFNYF